MRRGTGLLLALLALAGCGDEDHTQTDYTPSNDRTSTSADDSIVVPARVIPGVADTLPDPLPPRGVVGLALSPLGGSAVRGSGRAASAGTGTAIAVALSGGAGGATYEGAVRQGVCARIGPQVAALVPATADTLGNGRAASDVPVPLDSLTGGPHVVVYGRGGRPEACAAIGAASAPPPAEVAAADTAPPPP